LAWRRPAIDFSIRLNDMSFYKLPTSGEDLAYATREYVAEAYEEVRNALEWRFLPQGLAAIWAFSPTMKEVRREFPHPKSEFEEICHIIVTFPGSAAVDRIRDILIQSQIVPNADGQIEQAQVIAAELFTLTMRYTRVQNLARHIRTAVNSHLKSLGIETSRERARSSTLYEPALRRMPVDEATQKRIHHLRGVMLKSNRDVDDWADDVNNLFSIRTSHGVLTSERIDSATKPRSTVASSAINSYKLRFKQALASTLGIDLSERDSQIEKTSNKSIEGMLRELEELPSNSQDLYQMLTNLRPRRTSRPDITTKDFTYELKTLGNGSSRSNLVKHVLSLGGRELIIEGTRGGFTSELALGLIKTVSLQLSIEPDASELNAAFESRGQMLRVRIQNPKKSDRSKLSEILMQLV